MNKKYVTHKREPFFQLAIDLIKAEDRVLDIGPGNGQFADQCKRKDIYFLEGNEKSANYLKERFENVHCGELPVLPFGTHFFNLIHISHVVEHLHPAELYETLKELDRCCVPGGAIVISTPVLWEGFYDDLSHIKPYNPVVFQKYLCNGNNYSLTRKAISESYKTERLVYRLKEKKILESFKKSKSLLPSLIYEGYDFVRKNIIAQHKITGYTLVLRKQNKENQGLGINKLNISKD